jgi:cytochrome c oxidase subunit 2
MFQGFQSSVTPLMDGIIMFHNYVMFYLVVIFVFVFSFLARIVKVYAKKPMRLKTGRINILSWRALYLSRNLTHATSLEVIWTTVPGLVLLSLAFPSFALLYTMDEALDPDVTLKVIGHQWYWSYSWYTYSEFEEFDSYMIPSSDLSQGDSRLLEVDNFLPFPVNANVCVLVTSDDVLHSWAVPSFGVKIDCVPGRLNQVNLNIYRPGIFFGQCSELCGVNHGFMPIEVRAYNLFDFSCIISANPSFIERLG